MHVRTIEAAAWWARPRGETSATWIANYQKSLTTRHRDVIVAAVRDLRATSVLEVGSHCGPNLVRLAQEDPTISQLTGVDVNAEAIEAGTRWVKALGLDERIQLATGRMPEASATLPDGCVDVVLSCYALAYIAPPDLDAVLWELGRLARRGIVIAEPMTDKVKADEKITLQGYQEWAHNYRAAQRFLGSWAGMTISSRPVEPPVDQLSTVLVAVRGPGVVSTP